MKPRASHLFEFSLFVPSAEWRPQPIEIKFMARINETITQANLDGSNAWEMDIPMDTPNLGYTLFGNLGGGTFTIRDQDGDVLETLTPPVQDGKIVVAEGATVRLEDGSATTDLRFKALTL